MTVELGYILAGVLLVVMALSDSVLRRLPITTPMLYLAVGVVLGPLVFSQITLDAVVHAHVLERVTEIVVVISLFAAG